MTTTTNTTDLRTKGCAVISAAQVIEARTYLAQNPGTSAAKVRAAVGLDHMSLQAFDRTLRGVYHSHLDMCGLSVRPMVKKPETEAKHAAKAAIKAARKSERKATISVDVTGLSESPLARLQDVISNFLSAWRVEVLAPETEVNQPAADAPEPIIEQPTEETPVEQPTPEPAAEPEVVEPELVADPEAPAAEVEVVEAPKGKRNRKGGRK